MIKYIIFCIMTIMVLSNNALAFYKIEADQISGQDNIFIAEGNVSVTFKKTKISADKVVYFHDLQVVEAEGNITLKDDYQNIVADRITYKLSDESGVVKNIKGTLDGKFHICARSLQKTPDNYIIAEGLVITTCSGEMPDWSFQFEEAKGKLDGYLISDDAKLKIKDNTIFYLPKFIYPLKVTRQTGLLAPSIGYTSSHGMYLSNYLFIAMSHDKDLTISPTVFSKRGLMIGSEFRYALDKDSYVYLQGDTINDSRSDTRNNKRWKYTSKSTFEFNGFKFIADLNNVADYKFIRDFYEYSLYPHKNSENNFNNKIALRYDDSILGDLQLYYSYNKKYSEQDDGVMTTIVSELPSISLAKYNIKTKLFNISYFAEWNNVEYKEVNSYFDNNEIKTQKKHYNRLNTYIKFYNNYDIKFGDITPYVIMHYTRWFNWDDNVKTMQNRGLSGLHRSSNGYERYIPEFGIKFSAKDIYKYYGRNRHGILNTIEYRYINKLDQKGLPNYIKDDRIKDTNSIRWEMNNYYKTDDWKLSLKYIQELKLSESKILAPLETVLEFDSDHVFNKLSLELDYYKVYKNSYIKLLENNFKIKNDDISLYFNYIFDSSQIKQYNTKFDVGLTKKIKNFEISGSLEWKGLNEKISTSGLSLTNSKVTLLYIDDCWSLGLSLGKEKYQNTYARGRKRENDYKIEIVFEMDGLGMGGLNLLGNSGN